MQQLLFTIPEHPTDQQFAEKVSQLINISDWSPFYIGDLFNKMLEEKKCNITDLLSIQDHDLCKKLSNYKPSQIQAWVQTSRKVDSESRFENLSYHHHEIAASKMKDGYSFDDQRLAAQNELREWLRLASERSLTAHELKRVMSNHQLDDAKQGKLFEDQECTSTTKQSAHASVWVMARTTASQIVKITKMMKEADRDDVKQMKTDLRPLIDALNEFSDEYVMMSEDSLTHKE
jgi:hypothetical protein